MKLRWIAAYAGMMLASTYAQAAQITYTGTQLDLNGTGFGNVTNLLTVQRNGSEYGAVLWNGSTSVLTGDAKNTSRTWSATDLVTAGITGGTGIGLVFNINEPGNAPTVTLHDFTVHFTNGAGQSLFDATYSAPSGGLTLTDAGGTGQAGRLFQIVLSANELNQFFGDGSNRIGMSISRANAIGNTFGGPENFFLIPSGGNGPNPGGTPVPEPASVALWAVACIAALAWRRILVRAD